MGEKLPPPSDGQTFEELCLDVWSELWDDKSAQRYGRSGQGQEGIDVFGKIGSHWLGVQCKQKNERQKLTISELEEEVSKALDFRPALSTLIVATTSETDTKVQTRARELTDEHAKKGLFNVEIWAWREILREIYRRPDLLARIGPIYWPKMWNTVRDSLLKPTGSVPSLPSIFVGRERDVALLKEKIGVGQKRRSTLTAIRGWPGVGKTTLISAIAHDDQVKREFPDGVLWASLGEKANVMELLRNWALSVGLKDANLMKNVPEATSRIAGVLRDKRMLLLVDDVWQAKDFSPFQVGGSDSSTILTTRATKIANELVGNSESIFRLDVLSEVDGIDLLKTFVPNLVKAHEDACRELVRTLEGLPLALHVAGRLLRQEASYGIDAATLVRELQTHGALLSKAAPIDRIDPETGEIPTVNALFAKSTSLLDPEARACFFKLGVLAPEPATINLGVLSALWERPDPLPVIRHLVDFGLLEAVAPFRYKLHALLMQHAKSGLED